MRERDEKPADRKVSEPEERAAKGDDGPSLTPEQQRAQRLFVEPGDNPMIFRGID